MADMPFLGPGLGSLAFFAAAFVAPVAAPRSEPAGGRIQLPVLAAQAFVQRPQHGVGVAAERSGSACSRAGTRQRSTKRPKASARPCISAW